MSVCLNKAYTFLSVTDVLPFNEIQNFNHDKKPDLIAVKHVI